MDTYCVIYRTGGHLNFRWRRTTSANRAEVDRMKAEVEHMGYRALVLPDAFLRYNDLPDTYEPDGKYLIH